MRRAAMIALLSLVVVALVGAPIAATGRHARHAPRAVVTASAGRAAQGGTLVVRAKVFLPWGAKLSSVPSATAVVHFASGDVSVDLSAPGRRRGDGLRAWPWWPWVPVWSGVARVPVGATEQPGRVRVDVTVALADGSVTVLAFGRVLGTASPERSPTPTPSPTPSPQPET